MAKRSCEEIVTELVAAREKLNNLVNEKESRIGNYMHAYGIDESAEINTEMRPKIDAERARIIKLEEELKQNHP